MSFLRKFSIRGTRDLATDIVRNLDNVLNTKKGFGSILPDFGIDDYSSYGSKADTVKAVMEEIEDNVRRYEPRVRLDLIEEVSSEQTLRLSFRMVCTIRESARPMTLRFDSVASGFRVYEG